MASNKHQDLELARLAELETLAAGKPEPPEAYLLMMRMDYPNHYPVAGGFFDQPHAMLREFEAVQAAIDEHRALRAYQARDDT